MLPFLIYKKKGIKICTLHMKPLEFIKMQYPKMYKYIDNLYWVIDHYCLRRMDVIVAINKEVKMSYLKRYPRLTNKLIIINGSGVDLHTFKPMDRVKIKEQHGYDEKDYIILFVGRLEKIKNVEFIIKSLNFVLLSMPRSKLLIIGRGPDRERLQSIVVDRQLHTNVAFLGEIPPLKMPEFYNLADILVLASKSESSPTVVREAISCGTPVVTIDIGDVRTILSHPNLGMIVESYDEKMFAKSILKYLKLGKLKPETRVACREYAYNFSFDAIAEKYLHIYNKLINFSY